uniref:hypothetical protein n=1 Tax=Streptomyces corallincola TaxID=2851888 RepID=UPI001FE38910|nr:hypothetical protein [Streptomyces corallincola]
MTTQESSLHPHRLPPTRARHRRHTAPLGPLPVHETTTRTPPTELRSVSRTPMPAGVRGAVVTSVAAVPGGTLKTVWVPATQERLPAGRIVLSWEPAGEGLTTVTAHLRLARGEVLLATWPLLTGEWSDTVRPTLAEVTELHAALRLAANILEETAGRE